MQLHPWWTHSFPLHTQPVILPCQCWTVRFARLLHWCSGLLRVRWSYARVVCPAAVCWRCDRGGGTAGAHGVGPAAVVSVAAVVMVSHGHALLLCRWAASVAIPCPCPTVGLVGALRAVWGAVDAAWRGSAFSASVRVSWGAGQRHHGSARASIKESVPQTR